MPQLGDEKVKLRHYRMLHKKRRKEPGTVALAGVKKEMARPRMVKSTRITELILDTA
jgi:hypothetical protein